MTFSRFAALFSKECRQIVRDPSGMLSLTLSVAAIILVFHVPFRGSFLLLGASGAEFLLSALGLGLFISTVAKNQFVACQIAFLAAFMPSLMLSGFIFEISSMPAWIQYICNIIPAKYFITCLHSLFLVGNVPALLGIHPYPPLREKNYSHITESALSPVR